MFNRNKKPSSSDKKSSTGSLLALVPFFKPYKFDVFLSFLSLLITSFTILFFGKAIKYLIDYGFAKGDGLFLNKTLAAFVAATLVMAIAGYYRSSLINKTAEKVISDLRKKVYDHVIRLSAEFFEFTKAGEVISRLTVDTVVLYNVISTTISFFLRNLLLFIGGLCFLFFTSVKLSLISFMLIPIAIAPIIFMGKSVKGLSNRSQEALAAIGSHIEESINGVRTIQSYLCEEKESRNFFTFVDSFLKISLQRIQIKALMIAVVIAFAFGGIAIVLWIGGNDVLHGKITSGDLSSFIFYSIVTATSLVSLSQVAGQAQIASAAAERIFALLKVQSPVKEAENPQKLEVKDGISIKFHNVGFSYPSRKNVPVLKNFSLEIKPREKIALVGFSGAGKSTVLQLLLRFYDIDSGLISLNDCDVRSLSFSDLRRNFSYISQDCFIFSGTIFENIAYVDKSITEEQVLKIIEENSALHFINELPQNIYTFVGEKGIKLSGGERQRIALARAIIKDSAILLLDEATSALDNYNEQIIARAISDLSADKTVILVAHKLSSIISANRIVFIKDGEIAEIGSHKELISWNGLYKKMYETEMM